MALCISNRYSINVTVVAVWAIFVFSNLAILVLHSRDVLAAPYNQSALLEIEANALLQCGWWSGYVFYTPASYQPHEYYCNWTGITCNHGGSITHISLHHQFLWGKKLTTFNFSSFPNLVRLDLRSSRVMGSIPPEIAGLSNLTHLLLSDNRLSGQLPPSLGNLSHLVMLDVSLNEISGFVPRELGNLKSLVTLSLSNNHLNGTIPPTLGLLTRLQFLNISENHIQGRLPTSLGNLSDLVSLDASLNHEISGSIGSEMGKLGNLQLINLEFNKLSGTLPSNLCQLTKLQFLYLGSNQIHGSIPPEIGELVNLRGLDLSRNMFSGPLPSWLGNLRNLKLLQLKANRLTGPLPSSICQLANLEELVLAHNQLSGAIPLELGNMKTLNHLDLGFNNFRGKIPLEKNKYSKLTYLDLSHNSLTGNIPSELGNLENLRYLDLSGSHLSGNIPACLASSRLRINLSYNSLEGQIPYEFEPYCENVSLIGNVDLCSGMLSNESWDNIPSCSQTKAKGQVHISVTIVSILVLILASTASILLFMIINNCRLKGKKSSVHDDASTKNGDIFSIWNYDGRIAYEDITKATENFDIKYCIGTGGYGSVYKAQLPNGKVVALKKLHGSEAEEPSLRKSFMSEVKSLAELRHRSIIKLHGFCLHQRCMFLIYEYMERGSLFCVLSNDAEAVELDWKKRVTVVKDIAHALCYLHNDCTPPIVHRDVSTNNILLNSTLKAFVSDFGTARLLHHDASNQTVLAGTYGYIAPGKFSLLIPVFCLTHTRKKFEN